jgi:hypothetical protein
LILHLVYTTTPGAPVYTTTQDPFAVSGLRVHALVSGLLHSMIQPAATNGSWAAMSDKGL